MKAMKVVNVVFNNQMKKRSNVNSHHVSYQSVADVTDNVALSKLLVSRRR